MARTARGAASTRLHGPAPRAGRQGDVNAAGPRAAALAALPGGGPGGRAPRVHLEDAPRPRGRRLGRGRRHDHARPEPRGDRDADPRGAMGSGRPEPGAAVRASGHRPHQHPDEGRAQGGVGRAQHAAGDRRPRHAHRGVVRRSGRRRPHRTAHLPERGDRARPPRRVRADRARCPEAGPRRDRVDGQRRDPRGRNRGCAACSSAAARRCPTSLSPWSR